MYFLPDNWNLCLLKLSLYFHSACRVALCVLIVGQQRWIWFWILWQWMLQLIHQSYDFGKIYLVLKTHHLSPPCLSQGLALFRKGLSLPLSLYGIYTHGCRMHGNGVSLRVNKKLKYSLISQKNVLICVLQKHSMSSSKCILLEQILPYLNIIY